MLDFPLFPDQASSIAQQIDLLYFALLGLGAFFGLGVASVLVYLAVKYRAAADVDRSNAATESIRLEVAWALIPLGLAVGMFGWGAAVYVDVQAPPSGEAIEIYAVGKQWMWQFQHENGAREINMLHVPTGLTVRMIMTSEDVIHGFFVPAFRIKQDVLPGRFTSAWFVATNTGTYHLFCAEYCGTEHSFMKGRVVVMTPPAYEQWLRLGGDDSDEFDEARVRNLEEGRPTGDDPLAGGQAVPDVSPGVMAAAGAELFDSLRCNVCHRTESAALTPSTGPPLEGVFGRRVTLHNEREIVADEQYLLESILYPSAKLVQGYPPVMPTYAGQLNETQLNQLVAYLKSISEYDAAASEESER